MNVIREKIPWQSEMVWWTTAVDLTWNDLVLMNYELAMWDFYQRNSSLVLLQHRCLSVSLSVHHTPVLYQNKQS